LENICAAVTAAYLAGADISSIQNTVAGFKGLEHRLELVGEVSGVKYYNDSFSTTPDTAIAAIKSFSEPIILFLGGSEKNADYRELADVITQSTVKMVVPIGLTADRIIKEISNPKIEIISGIKSMSEAISLAQEKAQPGDVVILSPASASFDRYKNYQERGQLFKELVLK
jgi:UDP-N-acetylmuramoylalanine--D-glutamate ligase